jgi:hypothetical protein
MAAESPILELSTLEPIRSKIKIDAKLYELARPSDFGLRDQHWLSSRATKIFEALGEEDLSDGQLVVLESTLDEYIRKLVHKVTAAVVSKLSLAQKIEIINVFTAAAVSNRPPTKSEPEAQ